jgi:hypothetical protein
MSEPVLRVKNWREFQHYTDRRPPWIKLHVALLDDFDFQCLPLASRALAPMLWLLASASMDGSFVADPAKLAFRLRWDVKELREGLTPLIAKGFLIADSEALATCQQSAPSETETETETEPSVRQEPDVGRVFDHWKTVHAHPKAKLDDKRKRLIRGALKHYSADDLCRCITGYKRSPHHMGQNERKTVYDDIETFLRDAKHIDAGLKYAGAGTAVTSLLKDAL